MGDFLWHGDISQTRVRRILEIISHLQEHEQDELIALIFDEDPRRKR
jgi:hypothetical protein